MLITLNKAFWKWVILLRKFVHIFFSTWFSWDTPGHTNHNSNLHHSVLSSFDKQIHHSSFIHILIFHFISLCFLPHYLDFSSQLQNSCNFIMCVAKLLCLMLLAFNERVLYANRELIAMRLFWLGARVSLLSQNVGFFVVVVAVFKYRQVEVLKMLLCMVYHSLSVLHFLWRVWFLEILKHPNELDLLAGKLQYCSPNVRTQRKTNGSSHL